MERSAKMVIGLLAILKSGGAYLVLDSNHPQDRLDYMLQDANPYILIVNNKTRGKFRYFPKKVCLSEQRFVIDQENSDNPKSINFGNDLAYIIYTSGSTGKPKGICATHSCSINRFSWMWDLYRFATDDVFGQKTSANFVDFMWELFGPLLQGIKVVIIKDDVLKHYDLLAEIINKFYISHLVLVPSFIKQLIINEKLYILNNLKQLNISGEKLDARLVNYLLKTSIKTILNLYGSSEVAGDVTYFDLRINNNLTLGGSIIGKPIANTQIYILDQKMNLVKTGVIGQIYVAGANLTRGYLNNPEISKKKFITNIFKDHSVTLYDNSKLYKTGDLGRYLEDGNIEFISRLDQQVKIRGYRIELNEIEQSLQTNNNIADYFVSTKIDVLQNTLEENVLVLYIVPKNQEFFSIRESLQASSGDKFDILTTINSDYQKFFIEELKKSLNSKLPNYMVPDFYVCLSHLPLNSNGKIDYNALLLIKDFSRLVSNDYIEPITVTQRILENMIAEILRVKTISIKEDMVMLGGYSLLAMQIISRIRNHFKIEIGIKDLYKNRTILQLSNFIENIKKEQKLSVISNILPSKPIDIIPLSSSQKHIWLAEKIVANTNLYNVYDVFKIEGPLEAKNLELAINKVIDRHEILRTVFIEQDNAIYQKVITNLTLKLNIEIILDSSCSLIDKKLYEEISKPFDLSKGPLIRVKLFNISFKKYLLSITLHHIIFDPWSMNILLKEISQYYNQVDCDLEKLAIQYRDFVIWYKRYRKKIKIEELEYWQNQLHGIQPLILPTDKPKLNNGLLTGASYKYFLSTKTRIGLIEIAKKQDTSIFVLLMSAFFVLLHKYSCQDDIVIGVPMSCRNHVELESLIGYFVNMVCFRIKFDKKINFQNIVKDLTFMMNQAHKYHDMNIQKLLNILDIDRSLTGNALFQTIFTYDNISHQNILKFSDLNIQKYEVKNRITDFDLSFHIHDSGKELELEIIYATELFDKSSIERIAVHFNEIIKKVIQNANISIINLSVLTNQEEKQMLYEWNDNQQTYTTLKTVQQLFQEQVKHTPSNVAVIFDNKKFLYQDLNLRSNKLAHYLRRLGIGRNDLVGVAVDRSFEMMVAIIAVLKAGGAFVPLDPNYPEERLELIIHDTCLSTIIIDKSFIGKISTVPIKKVSIDKDQALIDLESDIDPIHINTPEDLAYIIYTSGSTGTPKGVMIEHQALSNLLYGNKSNMLSVDETTVIASFSSVNFDAFIWEWSCVLVKGGTLVLLSGLDTIVEDKISCFIEDHKINYLSTTASILNLLPISIAKQLRTLAIFGDTSKYEVVKKWCEYTNVYNGYGPTENSITSTIFQCNKNLRNILPIGKPITNVKIYILDNYLKLVPIGVYGEIYIGGRGLARGYLNRKDLTTEKFIDNPFRDRNSQNNYDLKLYKTGDLGRYLEDGNIDFLGRTDSQVKVRGFRVELSEIEYHLLNHELIKDSIVVMKKNNLDPENKLLLAYIVPINIDNFKVRSTLKLPNKKKIKILTINKSSKIGNNDIKKYLRSKMPEFMIPNHFIFLNKIPLTINGKIDRAYLASLSLFKEKLDKSGYLAPSNIIQQKICRIFSEVLGLKDKENIGILDNFFQLGGDSIAAMKLVGILKKEFKADIAMTDIFLCQTPQKLWEKIFFKEKQQENIIEIKSIENSFGGEFSLLPIQSWFFSNNFIKLNHWNQSFLIQTNVLDINRLQEAVDTLVEYHDSFRLRFRKLKNSVNSLKNEYVQYYQNSSPKERLKILNVQSWHLEEESEEFAIKLNDELTKWQSCFDLKNGPIYAIGYIYGYKNGNAKIYFALHHLIVDVVSWRILVEDLQNIYYKKTIEIKGNSYQEWEDALKTYKNNYKSEINYWLNHQQYNNYHTPNLQRLIISENHKSFVTIKLNQSQSRQLLEKIHNKYNTQINDILLTALSYSFFLIFNSRINYILIENHGREKIFGNIDVSRTVGWFTSLYPLRLEVFDKIGDNIINTKETLRQVPNKGIGYGVFFKYQNELLPKITFNYLGRFDSNQFGNFWNITDHDSGNSIHHSNYDNQSLTVECFFIENHFVCNMNSKLSEEITKALANAFQQNLSKIIDHCLEKKNVEYSFSDFNDFHPFLILKTNNKQNADKVFLFPPGKTGSESYLHNLVPKLHKYDLILFNNFYHFLEQKLDINSMSYEKLAHNYICYMKSIQSTGPYSLLGWSFGGVLAFEISKQLIETGNEIRSIVMIDSFFGYKTAVNKTNTVLSQLNDINYHYNPNSTFLKNIEISKTNITLFKSTKVIDSSFFSDLVSIKQVQDMNAIFAYYVKDTLFNNLDYILSVNDFQIINMNHDHQSWLKDAQQLDRICSAITPKIEN